MNDCFLNNRYAIMRHGKEVKGGLHFSSQEVCTHVVGELAQKIPGKSVRIYHSPSSRAKVTAHFVRQKLLANGIAVAVVDELDWLGCEAFAITNDEIGKVVNGDEGFFTLFISHLPDIEQYLDCYSGVTNCSIFAAEFEIRGH